MAGCFRCPVNCRPMNDLRRAGQGRGDRYDAGDGPEYVTLGKLGPNLGISDPRQVIRLNNIANDLGLDTASAGSAIAWAMELHQRGIIGPAETGGLELAWGDAEMAERLLFMTARREGFGDTLALSARAVDAGRYPAEALRYRMAVKGLFQSDPHDARILKAFALGLAVATRGMDHLRNRATLEINSKINDDAAFKRELYGGEVSASPTSYEGKELAVRVCEDVFAVGDSVGMCRFTTRLFNSPTLPGLEQFSQQIANVTGIQIAPAELRQVGLAVTGLERMINHRLGVRRADDTLPRRWFEEGLEWGAHRGEKIDEEELDRMRERFYRLTGLDEEGQPEPGFRARLAAVAAGFAVSVKVPPSVRALPGGGLVVTRPIASVRELAEAREAELPGLGSLLREHGFNVVVNDEVILHGRDDTPIKSGDRIELMVAMSGG
jgi:aldehyde:ferredoxin oxidoreductase